MSEQDFKPFASSSTANVISQSDYLASTWLPKGFSQGLAYSNQVNKVLRQSSLITAAIAQAIADVLNVDVIDDGTITNLEASFIALFPALNRLYAVDTGTVNNVVINLPAAQKPTNLGTLVGVPLVVKISNTNTGAATINVSALGAVSIANPDASALSGGQLTASALAVLVYDGTRFALISTVTGPLTSKTNTWQLAQTWAANGTFQQGVTAGGSITGASLVSTGGISAASGAVVTGYDSGGAQFRVINGNYGAIMRNDGSNLWLLQTASGSQYGTWNSFQPFSWNFTSGVVTIDGTGLGTTFGGKISVSSSINAGSTIAAGTSITAGSGLISTGIDPSGGGQIRLNGSSYGVMIRNDDTSCYLLQTAPGSPSGSFNSLRPLYWNLSNGKVTIDGTGAGVNTGGAFSIGGALNVTGTIGGNSTLTTSGTITSTSGRLRAAQGAYNSGDSNAAAILSDWSRGISGTNVGWTRDPSGLIEQTQAIAVPVGGGLQTTTVTLPITYPTTQLDAIISFLGNTPPSEAGSISVQPATNSQVNVTTNYPSSGNLGVVIRSRGY